MLEQFQCFETASEATHRQGSFWPRGTPLSVLTAVLRPKDLC